MTRKGAAKAWGTKIRTFYVRRSFTADTERHCSAIGEAGRAASTDAYGTASRTEYHGRRGQRDEPRENALAERGAAVRI